jgi:putative hydrolase of the HAD superfamily
MSAELEPAVPKARAICCDVDGTLYHVRRLEVAWRLRWERGLLVALMAAREKIRHEAPHLDGVALLEREAELVAPTLLCEVDEARARIVRLEEAMPEALTRGKAPYPGVRSALEAAHVRGLRLAICSDYPPEEKLRWLGLDDLPWAAKVHAEGCGALKPHPRAFQRVAEILDLEPSDVVHVGDSEVLDVAGALGAGMRVWRYVRRGKPDTRAEHSFSRWSVNLFRSLAQASGEIG